MQLAAVMVQNLEERLTRTDAADAVAPIWASAVMLPAAGGAVAGRDMKIRVIGTTTAMVSPPITVAAWVKPSDAVIRAISGTTTMAPTLAPVSAKDMATGRRRSNQPESVALMPSAPTAG